MYNVLFISSYIVSSCVHVIIQPVINYGSHLQVSFLWATEGHQTNPHLRLGLKMPEFQQPLVYLLIIRPELGYKEGYCFCWTKSHSGSISSFICYMNLLSRPNLPKVDAW